MQLYLLVALGGALGSVLRFSLNGLITPHTGDAFAWLSTLLINVTGSFLIGFIYTLTEPDGRWFASPGIRLFLMTGICGGYTTFSPSASKPSTWRATASGCAPAATSPAPWCYAWRLSGSGTCWPRP